MCLSKKLLKKFQLHIVENIDQQKYNLKEIIQRQPAETACRDNQQRQPANTICRDNLKRHLAIGRACRDRLQTSPTSWQGLKGQYQSELRAEEPSLATDILNGSKKFRENPNDFKGALKNPKRIQEDFKGCQNIPKDSKRI